MEPGAVADRHPATENAAELGVPTLSRPGRKGGLVPSQTDDFPEAGILPEVAGPYRTHLQAAVASSAAPYGYTLTVWTSGAVATHADGVPSTLEALLFLAGAVAGFAAVGAAAHGSAAQLLRAERAPNVRLWGAFHVPSVGLAIGCAALVAHLVHGVLAWPLVGCLATITYLVVIAAQFTIAESR